MIIFKIPFAQHILATARTQIACHAQNTTFLQSLNGWMTIVRAIKPFGQITDKSKINRRTNLAQQVIGRNRALKCHHLKFGLVGVGFFNMAR